MFVWNFFSLYIIKYWSVLKIYLCLFYVWMFFLFLYKLIDLRVGGLNWGKIEFYFYFLWFKYMEVYKW